MQNVGNYTVTIGAGSVHRHPSQGRYFKIISATGPVNVRTERFRLNALIAGQGMEDVPYDYLEITDASGASNTITFVVGDTGFIDGLQGSINVATQAPVQSGSFANSNNTVTSGGGVLVAANTARKYLLIQNNSTTGTIYVRFGSAATVATGVVITPGGVYEMSDVQSTQAVYAIGDIASNANVTVVEG